MKSFLQSRWRGAAPLEAVFLRDTLLVGTAINIAAAVAAYLMREAEMPEALALLVRLAPVPWSLFLALAVWRCADRDEESAGTAAKAIGVMWLMTMLVLQMG